MVINLDLYVIVSFAIGMVIGGAIMFFVKRNNPSLLETQVQALTVEIQKIKSKVGV